MNECQNAVTSDSEGHDSDNAALQIMATDMESDVMQDIDRYTEETEYLNFMKGKNSTTSFLPEGQKGGKVRFSEEITYIPNKERTCLSKDQATQIYEEIEKNETINIQIVSQGTENKKKVRQEQICYGLVS